MKIFGHATYVGNTGYNSHCQNFFRALSKTNEVKIRNYTIGKNWRGMNGHAKPYENPHGNDVDELDKKLLAKQSLWTKDELLDYNIYDGMEDFDYDVNIVLSEIDHFYLFEDYKGPKIYYTVWENTKYPLDCIEIYKKYDQIWVPSKWQAKITIDQGIDPEKIKVIPEGVDISLFYPENINYNDDKFRFLIFGRWDERKSTKEMIQAFKNVFGNNKKVELIISVDNNFSSDGLQSTEERLKKYDLDCDNIKILHFPEKQEYIKYLKTGHVFLSCSKSEGWNLPLIEAMACGVPSVYSNCSGQLEFAEGKGIPVKIKGEKPVKDFAKNFSSSWKNFEIGNWYEPDFEDFQSKILEIYNNYSFYKQKALLDSIEIRKEFTWENAAEKANEAINCLFNSSNFDYQINFLGFTDDHLGIYYNSNSKKNNKLKVKIFDVNNNILYEETVFANNECHFFTKYKENKSGLIFRIFDYYSDQLKLEKNITGNNSEKVLIPVSIGEIVDKITILKIKKEKIPDAAIKIKQEIDLLEKTILNYNIKQNFFEELTEINSNLWDTEDQIRIKENLNKFDDEFISLARNVYKLNDKRSAVKLTINKNYNSEILEYKHHAKTQTPKVITIVNESNGLGDTIAWMPAVDQFAQKNKDFSINYYTLYKDVFKNEYANINFFDYSEKPDAAKDNFYSIGCFDEKIWKQLNLQQIAYSALNLPYQETKPKIYIPNINKFQFKKKYICVATQSTFQSRYWNNEQGWNQVIDYLHELGYLVVCVDKHRSFGSKEKTNYCPEKVDFFLDSNEIGDVIDVINNCEFFIGLSSGLSWLAWALNKSVVLISGSVKQFFEFSNPYRVFNENVCNGCFNNNSFPFDKNNWMWCPENKDFECSKKISFEMVKSKIDLVISDKLSLEKVNSKTLINFVTESLGDNIAFSPYAEEYQKKFGGQVFVKTKWHSIFKSENKNVVFVDKNYLGEFDKIYDIRFDFTNKPMQKIICDQLQLEYKEIKPSILVKDNYSFNRKKKYICISVHSTAQMKYWNKKGGWDQIIEYLNGLGYDVYVIDKDETFGTREKTNCIPKKAINQTGNYPIEYRIAQIKNCEFFIGLSSGLSWLAWALGKKVVMISGCTLPSNEFSLNNYRVFNDKVCNGCLNDPSIDNVSGILSSWMYCPRNKDFECSKQIDFSMIKEKIDLLIKTLN